jgi:hypothetical protein
VRFVACGPRSILPPWRDVAQLNYFNPATRDAMIGVLAAIAQHCDGVRCDMAMLVLNDVFAQTWQPASICSGARPRTSSGPRRPAASDDLSRRGLLGREFQLQQQGSTSPTTSACSIGCTTATRTRRAALARAPAYSARLARFLENHDETRSVTAFGHRIRAAAALTFTLPGLRFVFDGQMEGAHVRPPVQLGRWPDDPDRPDIRDLYRRLTDDDRQAALPRRQLDAARGRRRGRPHQAPISSPAPGEAAPTSPSSRPNISGHDAQGLVEIGDLPPGETFDLDDQLSDQTFTWTRADLVNGLYVRLRSGDAHLFLVRPA